MSFAHLAVSYQVLTSPTLSTSGAGSRLVLDAVTVQEHPEWGALTGTESASGSVSGNIPRCEIPHHVDCRGHGSCDISTGRCVCTDNHIGSTCATNCGAHGRASNGGCSCSDGYTGQACTNHPDYCEYPRHIHCGSQRHESTTCRAGQCLPCCTACTKDRGAPVGFCSTCDCGDHQPSSSEAANGFCTSNLRWCDSHFPGWDADCESSC